MNKLIALTLTSLMLAFASPTWPETEEHAHQSGEDVHEQGVVKLTPEQQEMAGIVTEKLKKHALAARLQAPGEVKLNAYNTAKITSRVRAQVVKRHVVLGDHVTTGQTLVTLSSVEMAEAQGALLVADREWKRVKKLGAKVASARRYTEAQVKRQLAWAKVSAYGMTTREINTLLASGDARKANGEFNLLASRDGTVIQDDFIEGAVLEPGQVLLTITDESALWVEARLTPAQLAEVKKGATARIRTNDATLTGEVTQIHHSIDETTRTIAVRITVANPDDKLHPGEFVDVFLLGKQQVSALAAPDSAIVRSPDGDWQVFIADGDNAFRGVEVNVLQSTGGLTRIAGLEPGVLVVVKGAFFLQSEIAKSGFDIHDH